ncbi:hypothetical protein BJF79_05865 [Actinomadura sp. CNU-125]|uniref:family 1 glycosylhydrolase n=1 Tax=Actinomadura sp. CNU-125 TaxID=1904961 RepID=UPI000962CFA1|nr:family 1 glycosylhydrolase [Actinomadura sp. CNU-125]OLT37734.1 hypothetical protein BJF79_05865 [Actinomadura sp. CNU-125]
MAHFPDGFLWGAATAGHQVEGGNALSDHWPMEHVPDSPFVEPSGDACDSYHRFAHAGRQRPHGGSRTDGSGGAT